MLCFAVIFIAIKLFDSSCESECSQVPVNCLCNLGEILTAEQYRQAMCRLIQGVPVFQVHMAAALLEFISTYSKAIW